MFNLLVSFYQDSKKKFYDAEKINTPLVIIFFLSILLILINAFVHDPIINYDSVGHNANVEAYPFRLPAKGESREFFSPPIAYFFPSLVDEICDTFISSKVKSINCTFVYGKFAQFFQAGLFLITFVFFLHIAEIIKPSNANFKISLALLFAILPVNYKTFAMMRGEPYVVFFTAWCLLLLTKIIYGKLSFTLKNATYLGLIIGFITLSRQWGVLMFPAIWSLLLWFIRSRGLHETLSIARMLTISFAVAFIVASWFYFHLYIDYGTFTPLPRNPKPFSLSNQPKTFYRNTGIGGGLIFKKATRNTFDNQLIPILYSDMWGDYWGYFTFTLQDERWPNNQVEINSYLGQVNLVSIIPTLIFIFGFLFSLYYPYRVILGKGSSEDIFYSFLLSSLVFIWGGFFWFIIKYPYPTGDTIKATYILNFFHLLPFLGAIFLERFDRIDRRIYYALIVLLAVIWLHNLPAMISRYYWWA